MAEERISDKRLHAWGARILLLAGIIFFIDVIASFVFDLQYMKMHGDDVGTFAISLILNVMMSLCMMSLGMSFANRKKAILPILFSVVLAAISSFYFITIPREAWGEYYWPIRQSAVYAFAALNVLHALHALMVSLLSKKFPPAISAVFSVIAILLSCFAWVHEDLLGIQFAFWATHFLLELGLFLCCLGERDNIKFNVEVQKKTFGKKAKIMVLVFAVVATLIMIPVSLDLNDGMIGSATVKMEKEDNYGHDQFDAISIAESVVKGNLKSPSTAEFCKSSQMTVTHSGNTWTVKGWVDAQNSFGATLRNDFTVKITFTSKDKYTVDSCTIK